MNILEVMKKVIEEYPDIAEFNQNMHFDYTAGTEGEVGIFSIGDKIVSEDILGNETRRNDVIIYATVQSSDDYERLTNSAFITNLAYYLDHIEEDSYEVEVGTGEMKKSGKLKKMACANGMLYRYLNDTQNGPVQYQLQIAATYKIES